MNKSGEQVVLDENGILQSWQEGKSDNLDESNPLTLYVYLPDKTLSIYEANLNFRLLPFRSYSGTTESGGGKVITSASGGGTTATSSSGGGTSTSTQSGGGTTQSTPSGGNHRHRLFVDSGSQPTTLPKRRYFAYAQEQNYSPTVQFESSAEGSIYTFDADGNHSHNVSIPSHSHSFSTPNHTHIVQIPNHIHNISIPAHSHDIAHGIYTSTIATGIGVIINGINRTSQLGGKFNTSQANLDIGNYLEIGKWNEIELTSDRLGRIDGNIFIMAFLST
ncbi:hypothetical protein [Ornithinibacillus sp. 179-J 7C1 HS]|uniref:hypothetical protein n=1 Tax=Ornithinibacillus sp. 179-J 7C1 HS TaxID=3142384 RepID=UPI00399F0B66